MLSNETYLLTEDYDLNTFINSTIFLHTMRLERRPYNYKSISNYSTRILMCVLYVLSKWFALG